MKIEIARNRKDIERTFDVMRELRTGYDLDAYVEYVENTLAPAGVQLAYLEEGGRVVCVSGFRISASLAWGKFIYVDDLVTSRELRSRSYGRTMLDWLCAYGKSMGCGELHLDSGVQRHSAHRFYLRERMDIVFYHFRKEI